MHSRRRVAWCCLVLLCLNMAGCTISSTPGTKTPVSLSILPTNPVLPLGLSQGFFAIVKLHDGTSQDVSKLTQWSSSNTPVATIDNQGILKTVSKGTTTVTAVYGSFNASTGVTVTPPAVIAVNINPPNPSPIQVEDTLQFTATGVMSDGSAPPDITNKVKWASSNTNAATVSSGGLATGNGVGVTVISAIYGTGLIPPAGFVTLIVNPILKSINVIPSTADIAQSTNQQFTAISLYGDGSTQDITGQSSTAWTIACTPSGLATINAGLATTTTTTGSCTITATSGTVNNAAALTVSPLTLSALAVTPAVPKLPIGVPVRFQATGQFGTTGPVQDLTTAPGTKWKSSNTGVATITTSGKATTVAAGTVTITAQFGSTVATTTLTVTSATLSSIKVTAPLTKLGEGTTAQLTATGKFSDGSTQDLTNAVTWKSSGVAIAVSSSGLATANAPGSATVTASLNGVSGTSTLQVNAETIQSVAITPTSATIAPGTTQSFKATVTFSDNTQQDVTSLVQWNSSDASVATIRDFGASAGSTTGIGSGTANISAVFGSVTASTSTLTVTGATPTSLAITPGTPSLTLGTSQQMTATVTFSDSSTQDVTPLVTWSSDNINVIVVTDSGVAVTAGAGTAHVTATFTSPLGGSATNSTTITVQ